MERGVIVNQKRIFELGASTKRSPTGMGAVDRFGVGVLCVLAGFALLMLIAPSAIIIAISFTEKAYIGFPPSGFSFKWYLELLDKQQLIDSAVTSLKVAFFTTVLALTIGIPAAFSLVRGRFFGRSGITAFVVAPQMLPGMVIGIALLFFGASFGIYQSNALVIIAMTVFCLPFAIRVAMARLAIMDSTLDEASTSLGASRIETFFRITIPQLMPAIVAGGAFVFIEAFDNITVALFTASPRSRPLAVELYNLVQFDSSPIVAALSSLEILFAFVIMLVLARSVGLDRLRT